jgi:ABC transporter DrrB family efflux protein
MASLAWPAAAARRSPVTAIAQTAIMARRNLLHVISDPQQLIGMTAQPLMFLLLFVYVFGGAISGSTASYLQFVLPGLLVQGIAFGTTQTALGLNADFQRGLIDRFRSLPVARSAVVAGRVTADILRTVWSSAIITGVAVALGFRFHGGAAGATGAIGLVIALGVAMCWVMAFLGVALRSPEAVQATGFMLVMPLTFASSVLVPAASMPGWLQAFVKVNPVSVFSAAMRGLMLGGPVAAPVTQSAAWIAGICLVFGSLTIARYRRRA